MRTGEPSRTALIVAASVVLAEHDPALRAIITPDAAALSRALLASTRRGRRLLAWIDSRAGRVALRTTERCTIPGMVAHWTCRKCWIEDAWKRAHRAGFDTLLVLGSGFDTLSLRVAREGAARTIDVDHPATLAARRAGIAQLGGPSPLLIEHDLGAPGLGPALAGTLPPSARVFALIEGVLMYLGPHRVTDLFGELAALPCSALRTAFTFMEAGAHTFRPRSLLVNAWLARRGEPFRSSMDPATLEEWLRTRGFRLHDLAERPGHSLIPLKLPRGECAALADRLP